MSNQQQSSTILPGSMTKSLASIPWGILLILSAIFIINDGSGGSIEILGIDGAATITSADSIVNQYTSLASAATSGSMSIVVDDIADLTAGTSLAEDDLILLVQMQGATIKVANDSSFGEVTDYGEAGNYEYVFVESVSSNTITFQSSLQNSYTATGKTQVIRVPQYSTVTIQSGASVTAPAWDGEVGGIVAFTASDNVMIYGEINVTGLGFRGGAYQSSNSYGKTAFYSANKGWGGEKGESIAGSSTDYEAGGYRYCRGAIANGGGGGNGHNAGGGGGANGHSGNTWTGIGIMCQSCTGSDAWKVDPEYIKVGDFSTSSGGGRGGYSYSNQNKDALTISPGDGSWGGDKRINIGGYGGRPLLADSDEKIFLGGGGGAGHGNNNVGGSGGNGGGLVFLIAKSINGTGSINASGEAGDNTSPNHNDAPGGGGGGGTIVIKANTLANISLEADGGDGGNQLITNNEAEGPGGAGGGGFISVPTSSTATTSVLSGSAGTTTSTSLTEFPKNGATEGDEGEVATTMYINYPASSVVFPVEWVEVSAEWQGSDAMIRWSTAEETNSDYFALERSIDGEDFQEISRISAAGASHQLLSYSQADLNVAHLIENRLRYRLKQVDLDGNTQLSQQIELSALKQGPDISVEISPNPVGDVANILLSGTQNQQLSWRLIDMSGRMITEGMLEMPGYSAELQVDTREIASGRYIFRVNGSKASGSTQVLKR